jgi:hypothetical protein
VERDDNKRQTLSDGMPAPPEGGVRAQRARPWRRMSVQLVALIGESGFCALFGRAVRMLAGRYDWLSVETSRRSIDTLLDALERDMAGVDGALADIANRELLDTFTSQLATLIGEALTARLISEAGVADCEGSADAQEHK